MSEKEGGLKFDEGKLDYTLIDPYFKRKLAEVLQHGAKKYSEHSWMTVPNARARYIKALNRHLEDYLRGELYDSDSGLDHLAHVACNVMFLLRLDKDTPYLASWPKSVIGSGMPEGCEEEKCRK